jgi:predicted MPP superfamily phosphohydrolase
MRRSDRLWVGVGVGLFVPATAANIGASVVGADGIVTHASNLAIMFALPAWIPLRALFGASASDPGWIVIANALAVVGWLGSIRLVLAVRAALASAATTTRPSSPPPDPSRRRFLFDSASGMAGVGAVAMPGYATVMEPQRMIVRRYEIPITGLPQGLDGLRLVHFSDPHVGPRMPASTIERAVELGISLQPDLVVLTGDYIHDGTRDIERAASLVAPLVRAARIGAVGVLGNHDWWGNGPAMRIAMRAVGVAMIDNTRLWLGEDRSLHRESPAGQSLALVGLGDMSEDMVDIDNAFARLDPGTPRLVLAHQPDTAELPALRAASAPRMDLMLSGHTHGGQVRIPFIGTPIVPSRYGQKYAGGLVQGPRCPVLVSRGVGMSLLPVRLGVPPEIGLITLRRG